ncbi:unnamed protein product, partial [Ectocarpus sp. 12 AP-2014]
MRQRWVQVGKTDAEANVPVAPSPVTNADFDEMVRSCVRNDAMEKVKTKRAALAKRLQAITGGKERQDVLGQALREKNRHWDFLLKEMMWMADDFQQERKRHMSARKKQARSVLLYFRGHEARKAKKAKEEQLALRRGASKVARDVRAFWGKLNKVIAYKQRLEADECRRKAMDKHLVFLVKQTERYSSMVVETPRLPGIGEDGEEGESSSGSGSGRGDDSSSGEYGSSSEDDDGVNGAKEAEAGESSLDGPSGDVSSDPMDADEDAFSDDSGAYMEDIMMLRAGQRESEVSQGLAGGGTGSGGGGGRASSMEELEEEEKEGEQEEEFSEPEEDTLVDDETTLAEEERRAALDARQGRSDDGKDCDKDDVSGGGGTAGAGAALAELRALQADVELPVAAVVDKLYPATQLAPPPEQQPSAAGDGVPSPAETEAAEASGAVLALAPQRQAGKKGDTAAENEATQKQQQQQQQQQPVANGHGGSSSSAATNGPARDDAVVVSGGDGCGADGGKESAAGPTTSPRQKDAGSTAVEPPRRRSRSSDGAPTAAAPAPGAGTASADGLEGWIERAARDDSVGVGGGAGSEAGEEEGEFVPIGEDVDDETTLDAEEALAREAGEAGPGGSSGAGPSSAAAAEAAELARLKAEAELPIEELMRLYAAQDVERGRGGGGGDTDFDDDDDAFSGGDVSSMEEQEEEEEEEEEAGATAADAADADAEAAAEGGVSAGDGGSTSGGVSGASPSRRRRQRATTALSAKASGGVVDSATPGIGSSGSGGSGGGGGGGVEEEKGGESGDGTEEGNDEQEDAEFEFREEVDDETTLDAEAALAGDGDDVADELAALRAEADLPIEELRRLAAAGHDGEEEEPFTSDGFDSELDLEGEDDDAYRGGGGVEVSRLLDEAVGAGGDEDVDGEYEEEEEGGGDDVDDETTLLEEEERAAREGGGDGGAADGGGREGELSALEADQLIPVEELLKAYNVVAEDSSVQRRRPRRVRLKPGGGAGSGAGSGSGSGGGEGGGEEEGESGIEEGSDEEKDDDDREKEGGRDSDMEVQSDDDEEEEEEEEEGRGDASPDDADEALRRLEEADEAARAVRVPRPFLLAKSLRLREYQHAGLSWLVSLHERRLNGILADEMGLGKTVQTISLLAYLACHKGVWGPHLIVVPTSCIVNWETELKRFLPGFKVLTYYGNAKQRKELRTGWTKLNAFHVCITSYQLAVQDASSFKRKKWYHLILDEAQNIKNFKSQRWQTLLTFNSQRRLLLTGTPLQNSLMELWSLMHFLMPHVFRSRKEFSYWFSQPLTHMVEGSRERNDDLIRRLHSVVRPFLLRRLKKDVEKQLPGKHEHVVMCRLSRRQASLYEEFMARSSTRAALQGGNFMGMMNILMQLRKVCNHPDLFEARQIDSPFVLPPLDLGVGTQVLRSRSSSSSSSWIPPCGFPTRFGGVLFEGTAAAAAAAATGDGVATADGKLGSGDDGGEEKAGAGVGSRRSPDGGVSRSLIAPLWAHDLRDGLPGLDVLSTELLSRRATPAEDVLKMPSKLPLCIPDPTKVDKSLNLMPQVLYRLTRLRKTLRGQARERRRLMAAISLNRCGLLPGGGGGGAGMEEAHPLNWRLVRTARLLYGHP